MAVIQTANTVYVIWMKVSYIAKPALHSARIQQALHARLQAQEFAWQQRRWGCVEPCGVQGLQQALGGRPLQAVGPNAMARHPAVARMIAGKIC